MDMKIKRTQVLVMVRSIKRVCTAPGGYQPVLESADSEAARRS